MVRVDKHKICIYISNYPPAYKIGVIIKCLTNRKNRKEDEKKRRDDKYVVKPKKRSFEFAFRAQYIRYIIHIYTHTYLHLKYSYTER